MNRSTKAGIALAIACGGFAIRAAWAIGGAGAGYTACAFVFGIGAVVVLFVAAVRSAIE